MSKFKRVLSIALAVSMLFTMVLSTEMIAYAFAASELEFNEEYDSDVDLEAVDVIINLFSALPESDAVKDMSQDELDETERKLTEAEDKFKELKYTESGYFINTYPELYQNVMEDLPEALKEKETELESNATEPTSSELEINDENNLDVDLNAVLKVVDLFSALPEVDFVRNMSQDELDGIEKNYVKAIEAFEALENAESEYFVDAYPDLYKKVMEDLLDYFSTVERTAEAYLNNDISIMSMLPLEEINACLILKGYSDQELANFPISDLIDKLVDKNGDRLEIAEDATTVWQYIKDDDSGLESYESHLIDNSDGKKINLSQPDGVGMQTIELIVGKDGQLNPNNVRYIVKIYYMGYYNNDISFDLYSQSPDKSTRTKIEPIKKVYTNSTFDDLHDINGNPIKTFNAAYSIPPGDVVNPYVGVNCSIDERPDVRVELYELDDRNLTTPITSKVLNQDMEKINAGYRMTSNMAAFIVIYYIDGIQADLDVFVFWFTGSFPYVKGELFELKSGTKEVVSDKFNEDIDMDENVYTQEYELDKGKTNDNEYYLNLIAKNGEDDLSGKVVKAVLGHYDSISEVDSLPDIKQKLFSETDGYKANFGGDGLKFTLFFEEGAIGDEGAYKITIKTVEYVSNMHDFTDKPIIGEADPWLKVTGASGISADKVYVIENGNNINMDTYYGYGYQTILVNDPNVDLSKLQPTFEYADDDRVYAVMPGSSSPVDEDHNRDFTERNQQYTGVIDGNDRNYWVTFKKKSTNGPELFVYGPTAREVILDEYFEYKHDILIANIGNAPLEELSVELLDAENVKLDPYWTVGQNGNNMLSAFSTTLVTTQYGQLPNMAKIRLLPDGDGTVKGTLVIKAKGQTPVMITLNGTAQNPEIVTESLEAAVKYVPYQQIIATNNIHDYIETQFSITEGTLPDGVDLNPESGEIYGVPTEVGTYTFTVEAKYIVDGLENYFESSYKTYELVVKLNTDENVYLASDGDEGYSIKEHIGTQIGDYSFELSEIADTVFTSNGEYGEFVALWLNGAKLIEGADYDSESGSTKITIRRQTFENKTNPDGTNTIAMEFRKDTDGDGKGDSGAEMNRTAQNFTIKTESEADRVFKMIAALPSIITLDDKSDVQSARNAYDALSGTEQDKVTNYGVLIAAENKIAELEEIQKDETEANGVIALINAIPSIIDSSAKSAIEGARMAFDALTDKQKSYVKNYDRLEKAEKALSEWEEKEAENAKDREEAGKVVNLIDALPDPITLDSKSKVTAARNEYNVLTANQKEYVTNYGKLQNAEETIIALENEEREKAKINEIISLINGIPSTVTLNDKTNIASVRKAYDALTDEQKQGVVNYNDLIKAEETIKALEAQEAASAADKAAADIVILLINELPKNITLSNKPQVESVRSSYNELTDTQKALVSNYDDLTGAEKIIKTLEGYEAASGADKEAADEVIALINKIPADITLNNKKAVETARNAYNSLTDTQKKIVTNYDILIAAEVKVAELENTEYVEKKSVTFVGILVDKDGKSMADKVVEIHSVVQTSRADGNGSFQFNDVEFGEHSLFIKDDNKKIISQKKFNIILGSPLSLNEDTIVAENGAVFTVKMRADDGIISFLDIENGNKAPEVNINDTDGNHGIDIGESNTPLYDTAGKTDKSSKSVSSPKTGYNESIDLWIKLFVLSLCGFILSLLLGIKSRRSMK